MVQAAFWLHAYSADIHMVSAYQGTLYSLSTYYHLVGVGISLPTYSSDINVEIHDDDAVTRREYMVARFKQVEY